MTPVAAMPMSSPSSRPGGARTTGEGDPFSNLLQGAGGKAAPPARNAEDAAPEGMAGQTGEMAGEANLEAGDASTAGNAEAASPRIDEGEGDLSPLQRLSRMFGIFSPRAEAKDAGSAPEEDGIEDEGDGKADEIELPAGAAIALVAQVPAQQPRETGTRLAEGTAKPVDPTIASALENEASTEDGESTDQETGEDGAARRDGAARTASGLSATAAITTAADGAAAAEKDADDAPVADPGRSSEQGDLRVKVVGDTINVAPAPQNMRTVAGLAAAIAGDGEWRSAIEQMNTLETDVTKSQQAPLRDLKIQLNPANLGEVNARLRLTGEQLSVEIQVDSPEAYHRLSSERDAIVSSLRGLGFRVDDVTIQQQSQATGSQTQPGSGGRSGDASASLSQGSGKDQGQSGGNQNRSNNSIPLESDASPSRTRPSADGIYI